LLTADWIAGRQEFEELAPEWASVLPPDARPFDLHCWYAAWWDAFGGDCEPAVCALRAEGELVAVAPLVREGRGFGALANVHSSVFRPLARDAQAMAELLRVVTDERPARLRLPALPERDPSLEQLREASAAAGMRLTVEPAAVSPIVETSGDFDAWREQSKSRWGAPLERFRRKMGRDHDAVFSIVEEPADLTGELEDGFRVEASGWKGEAGTAILSQPQTRAFYTSIAAAFHERGELRLSRIVLDGETAAFDLCLLHGGRLYLLKTGFDERFRKLAPGLVMRLSIVERCFELGLDAHELLGDDSEWKRKFATTERRHVNALGFGRGPRATAAYLYRERARPVLKDLYHRLRRSGQR
jgi:CelD/BcsL family acetyltransferase involved in cellulose biosynthesis